MISIHPNVTAATTLVEEMAHTTLTLDTVYAIYGAIGLGVLGLWTLGVLAFGKVEAVQEAPPLPRADRATPVAP